MASLGLTFKQAIKDRLAAVSGLDDVMRTWGVESKALSAPEWIWLGRMRGDLEWAAIGRRRREETVALDVHISVVRAGGRPEIATERAFALMAIIDADLQTDPTVTIGAAKAICRISEWDLTEPSDGERVEANLVATIEGRFRLDL